jgi:hypothetical protein
MLFSLLKIALLGRLEKFDHIMKAICLALSLLSTSATCCGLENSAFIQSRPPGLLAMRGLNSKSGGYPSKRISIGQHLFLPQQKILKLRLIEVEGQGLLMSSKDPSIGSGTTTFEDSGMSATGTEEQKLRSRVWNVIEVRPNRTYQLKKNTSEIFLQLDQFT